MKILFNNLAGRQLVFLLLAKALLCPTTTQAAEPETAGARAEALLARMTLAEKIGQLTLFTGYSGITGLVPAATAGLVPSRVR